MLIKVAVVDDHRIIRDGVKAILAGNPEIELIFEAATGAELRAIADNVRPDLVLLDIGLPDTTGIELISFVREKLNSRVMILTAEMEEDIICDAVEKGADGFMNKDCSGDELLTAIQTIMDGEPYFGRNLSSIVYCSFKKKINDLNNVHNMPGLTDRERQIIQELSDGLSFKEIGNKLFISPRTVENHKNNILEKLELKNTIELVKYAIKHKIIVLE